MKKSAQLTLLIKSFKAVSQLLHLESLPLSFMGFGSSSGFLNGHEIVARRLFVDFVPMMEMIKAVMGYIFQIFAFKHHCLKKYQIPKSNQSYIIKSRWRTFMLEKIEIGWVH